MIPDLLLRPPKAQSMTRVAGTRSHPGSETNALATWPWRCPPVRDSASSPGHRLLNVLVVDDEPTLCALFCGFLRSDGHTAASAGDGTVALTKFRAGDFDLVITDETMTQMNGLHLAREIKMIRPEVPVVLLTGLFDDGRADDPIAGIDLVLGKPISRHAFRDAIAHFTSP